MDEAILSYLATHDYPRYEREEWDAFLKKTKFSFSLPAIHITGSNGKGATLHYLENIYRAAGYKVASFHSPYFYSPCEMIRVDGKEISEEDFARLFSASKSLFEKFDLSTFEIETYISFAYLLEKKPDICIIECGMGGEIDATNIFDPVLSIITSVSLEHTSTLGRTYSEIALSKAGIIKEHAPVLTGELEESAATTIKNVAHSLDAPYHYVARFHFVEYKDGGLDFAYSQYLKLHINSEALYQVKNACLAVEAVTLLQESFPVSEEAIRAGLQGVEPILHLERRGRFILDGAHNPEAIEALTNDLQHLELEGKPIHVLFAAFKDKNINVELPLLGTYVSDITLTTFDHKRARQEADYFLYIGEYPYREDWKKALDELVTAYPDDYILVTGSLAFASVVRKYLIENNLK